jgi:hypothetical protein
VTVSARDPGGMSDDEIVRELASLFVAGFARHLAKRAQLASAPDVPQPDPPSPRPPRARRAP